MGSFGPLFLVPFPYRNGGENWCFETFSKQKCHKCWKWGSFDPYF